MIAPINYRPAAADLVLARVGRRSLFRRYATYLVSLVSVALITSGGISAYFAYRDTRALVDELQREKAINAALRITQFIESIGQQMRAATMAAGPTPQDNIEARHVALLKLLRLAPAVGDVAWIDATGHERVRVSRVSRDIISGAIDRNGDPAVVASRRGESWFGPVSFRQQSEPHFEMAMAGSRKDDGTIIADINLKFVSDVVSAIQVDANGKAFVVDAGGSLIAHPDATQALRRANLSNLPQVQAAIESGGSVMATQIADDVNGNRVLAANAPIVSPGWHVIVEQPLGEAFSPAIKALVRTLMLLIAGIALTIVASLALAKRMAAPVAALGNGARRIGDGHLNQSVEIHTGDELEDLASQFNQMAAKLRESYVGLEAKVAQRTHELEEANRAKVQFLAAASHDLRQPVHALGLFVAHLQESENEEIRQHLIGKIAASSTAIAELIDALLDLSKLDAGAVEPRTTEFFLQPLFDRMEQAFGIAANKKGLRFRIRPTGLRVRTDALLLERILLNLCANAIRYTQQGGVIIAARLRGTCVRIEVWDTGIGIPHDQQPRIFEEFYQAAVAPDSDSKGLGLGLAIVERLSKLLELPLHFRSTEHRGSVFVIEVPVAAGKSLNTGLVLSPIATQFDGFSVLLIDDDVSAREAASGVLTHWGCDVCSASDGASALQLLSNDKPPRLIICDYHLGPNESGIDVVRMIRGRYNIDIAAVIVSADSTPDLCDRAARAGLHFLHKPLNAARLRALLIHISGSAAVPAVFGT